MQRSCQALPILDADMAAIVYNRLRAAGVKLVFGADVQGFKESKAGIAIQMEDAEPIVADMVVLATDVQAIQAQAESRNAFHEAIVRAKVTASSIASVGVAQLVTNRTRTRSESVGSTPPKSSQPSRSANSVAWSGSAQKNC